MRTLQQLQWDREGCNYPSRYLSDQIGVQLYDTWGLEHHELLERQLRRIMDSCRVTRHTKISEILATPGNSLLAFLEPLYEDLTTRRVELNSIRCNSLMDMYHIVYGCITQFNIDDIRFFVEDSYARRLGWFTFEKEVDAFERRNGFTFYWAMSEYTFAKLKKVLVNDFGFQ